ncbi:MAG: 50S ribosome-binding protein YggL [Aquabacterium sp.]
MAKQRSRRLRKKLHVGEFQEFGLAYKTRITPGSNEVLFVDALLDAWYTDFVTDEQLAQVKG